MILKINRPALLIIDVQIGFDNEMYWGGNRNNPQMEDNIQKLLDTWRLFGLPVFHVKHNSVNINSPLYPGNIGNAIKPQLAPIAGEPIISKNVNSAFIGTDLEAQLTALGITQVVITGIQTDHCVSTTARMAANLSFETLVVSDACATFDRQDLNNRVITSDVIHNVNLTSLKDEFATIADTAEIISEVARTTAKPHTASTAQ